MLLLIGVFAWLIGLVADLISFNRQLLEMTLERVRRLELAQRSPPRASLDMEGSAVGSAEPADESESFRRP